MMLLDVFCCAGGATRGYQNAGFTVVGVDQKAQPNYVGEHFVQADAVDVLSTLVSGRSFDGLELDMFAAIHASPPCQSHSKLGKQAGTQVGKFYADFIPQTREYLSASGLPYVIENVEGAPLIDPVTLCGVMFPPLRVLRHRLFESNIALTTPPHGKHPLVFTFDKRQKHCGQLDQNTSFVQVTGGGNCTLANARSAMGIDWMTKPEINEALPPAYTEHLGRQLMAAAA